MSESISQISQERLPKHVAIIMDGNGRWAKQRGKLRTFGHKAGVEAVRNAVTFALEHGIPTLTMFAFSSENWNRPADEVKVLMELFMMVLGSEVKKLHKNKVRLNVIGDIRRFDLALQKKIAEAEQLTAQNTALTLNIAANYGGRWDIARAAQTLAKQVAEGERSWQSIDQEALEQYTCMADLPELDLLIRTGGDHRVSNFLLWQLAYAELYFTAMLWPEFDKHEFERAVLDFCDRQRRFGKTGEQVESKAEDLC